MQNYQIENNKSAAFIIFLGLSPLFFVLAFNGIDNYFWCEDTMWLARVGRFRYSFSELFSFYGRDFNPMFLLTLDILTRLFGQKPFAINLTSIIIHFISGLLLTGIFYKISRNGILSGLLGVLWLISRHTDETLFWMAARPTALTFLWTMLIWHLLDSKRRRLKIIGLIIFLFSILTKETGLLLLPIYFVYYFIFTDGSLINRFKICCKKSAGLFLISFGYIMFRFIAYIIGYNTLYAPLPLDFIIKKFFYVLCLFTEIPLLQNYLTLIIPSSILIVIGLFFSGKSGKFGLCWIIIGLLPFLPISKHSSRYAMFAYPGFLLILNGLFLNLYNRFNKKFITVFGIIFFCSFLLYQYYYVFTDELDYDMRGQYIKKIAMQYNKISSQISDGPIIIFSVSGYNAQPEINAKCRNPKLNARIADGLWDIIEAADLIGALELSNNRVWLPNVRPSCTARVLLHTKTGFQWYPDFYVRLNKTNFKKSGQLVHKP